VPDEVLVVTANRRLSSLLRAPQTVVVTDAQDLKDRGRPTRVGDVLRYNPGVYVRQNGSYGGATTLSVRGSNGFDTRILVDGLPVIDPSSTQAQPDIVNLPNTGIERYELLYGNQSGLYGSNAVGGVLDLRTARPTASREYRAQVEGGSDNTYLSEVVATGPITEQFGYALSLRGVTSEGSSTRYNQGDPNNPFPSYSAPFAPFTTWYTQALNYGNQFVSNWRYDPDSDNPFPFDLRTAVIPKGDADSQEEDGIKTMSGRARVEWTPNDAVLAYAAVDGTVSNAEYDASFTNPGDDYNAVLKSRQWRASSGVEVQLTEDLSAKADVLYGTWNKEDVDSNSLIYADHNLDGTYAYGSAQVGYQVNDLLRLTAGADGTWQSVQFSKGDGSDDLVNVIDLNLNGRWSWFPQAPVFEQLGLFANNTQNAFLSWEQRQTNEEDSRIIGGWAEAAISGADYELQVAGRYDHHDGYGGAATFRVAGAYFFFDQRLKTFGSVGTGFRAPSLYERFSSFGDPDLEPQESVGYEVGLEARPWSWLTLGATWYRTDYDQLIVYYTPFEPGAVPLPNTASGYRNAGPDNWVWGIDAFLRVAPVDSPWEFTLRHNPQRSQQTLANGTTRPMSRVPDKLIDASATYRWSMAWLTVGARHVGERYTLTFSDTAFTTPVGTFYLPTFQDSYTTAYLAGGWEFLPGWEAYGRIENITDADYEEASGFTSLRPSVFLGVNASF
jgi:outer membrane cobalamin receptor